MQYDNSEDEDQVNVSSPDCSMSSYLYNEKKKQQRNRNTTVLVQWLENHTPNPYPTKQEKQHLAVMSGLSLRQLNDWFANARRNIKKIGFDFWIKKQRNGVQQNYKLYNNGSSPYQTSHPPPPPPPNRLTNSKELQQQQIGSSNSSVKIPATVSAPFTVPSPLQAATLFGPPPPLNKSSLVPLDVTPIKPSLSPSPFQPAIPFNSSGLFPPSPWLPAPQPPSTGGTTIPYNPTPRSTPSTVGYHPSNAVMPITRSVMVDLPQCYCDACTSKRSSGHISSEFTQQQQQQPTKLASLPPPPLSSVPPWNASSVSTGDRSTVGYMPGQGMPSYHPSVGFSSGYIPLSQVDQEAWETTKGSSTKSCPDISIPIPDRAMPFKDEDVTSSMCAADSIDVLSR